MMDGGSDGLWEIAFENFKRVVVGKRGGWCFFGLIPE